jgi:hypothetical protein
MAPGVHIPHWLEGAFLLATYVVLALEFYFAG